MRCILRTFPNATKADQQFILQSLATWANWVVGVQAQQDPNGIDVRAEVRLVRAAVFSSSVSPSRFAVRCFAAQVQLAQRRRVLGRLVSPADRRPGDSRHHVDALLEHSPGHGQLLRIASIFRVFASFFVFFFDQLCVRLSTICFGRARAPRTAAPLRTTWTTSPQTGSANRFVRRCLGVERDSRLFCVTKRQAVAIVRSVGRDSQRRHLLELGAL